MEFAQFPVKPWAPPENKFQLIRVEVLLPQPHPTVEVELSFVMVLWSWCSIRCLDPQRVSTSKPRRLKNVKIRSKLQGTRCSHVIIVGTSTEEITARYSSYYRPGLWNSPPDVICGSPRNNNQNSLRCSSAQMGWCGAEFSRRCSLHDSLNANTKNMDACITYVCAHHFSLIGYDTVLTSHIEFWVPYKGRERG